MANISHASLTGAELHEPKGVTSAALGEVYVADGTGSGNWSNVGTSSFTGMIADFTWPIVQSGWLELDGTDVNTTTFSALYDVMTIQMTGTRVSGSKIITSLSSTANMRVGYYVFGTGIASGTTIATIDSANQITLSANASSTGTATVVTSPWLLNTGTIRLPDLSTAGRYRRSRTSSTAVGQLQADQNKAHTHTSTGTTGSVSNDHSHTQQGTFQSGDDFPDHAHSYTAAPVAPNVISYGGGLNGSVNGNTTGTTAGATARHVHNVTISGQTSGENANHSHDFTVTSNSNGGTDARPLSIVVMTCVKT